MKSKGKSIKNFKVIELKLKNTDKEYFSRLFLEAKWFANHILSQDDVFSFDTKINQVIVKTPDGESERELISLSSQMKQNIFFNIRDNINGLSVRKKKGFKVGWLKFKKEVNSIPLSNQTFIINGNKVKFQKNRSFFRVRGIDQLPENPDIRCGVLVRKQDGIYIHICIVVDQDLKKQTIGNIGLDIGIKDHFTFSDGSKVSFSAKEQEKKIKKSNQSLSRKKKGSKNWIKAKNQIKKKYQKMNNIKKDASNKLISALSNFKVAFQDEMISVWQKGLFGKQVQHTILGRVKSMLQKNTDNLMLDRSFPTTQTCRECGRLNKHKLSERVYKCDCGYSCDRDTHSAINMLWFSGLEQASVERELDLWRVLSGIQSKHLSVKQEAP